MNPLGIAEGLGSRILTAPETTAVHGLMPAATHGMGVKPLHVPPTAAPTAAPKDWTHITPQSAIDRRGMPSPKFEPTPQGAPAAPAAPAAKPQNKMGWKGKLGLVGGIGAAGWIGNDMAHSFNNAPVIDPSQYQTAGDDELMDRLQKTAAGTQMTNQEEAFEMDIMQRLEKTASVVEAIHAIAQATGHSPQEIAQLADEDPEQFMQLHQELTGGQGEDLTLDPSDPQMQGAQQPETQGMPQPGPQVPQQAAPQEPTPQDASQTAPQGGLLQSMAPQADAQAVPQADVQPAPQGGLLQSMAPQADAQAVPQGAVDPQANQAQMGTPVGGAVDNSGLLQAIAQAASQGAQEGAQQAINQMGGSSDAAANPRAGAASVSHNPAGVDKTASTLDPDMLITRLEQTADALADTAKVMRNSNSPQPATDDKQTKIASLMASLEKTARENNEEKSKSNKGAIIGGVVGAAGGAKATHDWAKSDANLTHDWAIKDKNFQDNKAEMFKDIQHKPAFKASPGKSMEELTEAHLGNLKKIPGKTLRGGLGGAAVGAGIGYAADKLTDEFKDRKNDRKLMLNHVLGSDSKSASETLMANLEKTAFSLGGVVKGIGNFAKNVSGAGVRGAQKELGTAEGHLNTGIKNNITNGGNVSIEDASHRVGLLNDNVESANANLTKSLADRSKARGQAAIGAGGLVAGSMLSDKKDKTAAAESAEIEKVASENEVFMDGIFKEAAVHIIQMEMPKVKIYVDPMSKIRF
jgi:hypothetical protein